MTVIKKPNGKYEVRVVMAGRRVGRTFDRKGDAEQYDTWLNRRKQLGDAAPPEPDMTLTRFVEHYWRYYAIPNLSPKARASYKHAWGKHLEPRIGSRPLRQLTPKVLTKLRADLAAAGVGDPTILKAFTMLQSVLTYAVVEEKIPHNPARDVKKPRQRRQGKVDPPTPEQVEQLRRCFLDGYTGLVEVEGKMKSVQHAPHPSSALIVSLIAYGGLRTLNEIAELEVRDVGGQVLRVDARKTERMRSVDLLAPLGQDLREWLLAQGRPPAKTPIVRRPAGQRIDETWWRNWRRRIYRPAAEHVGLDGSRPYDLRHAFCSLLLWEGKSLAYVAGQAGHSVETCSRVYAHVLADFDPTQRTDAADRIRRAREDVRIRRAM